VLDGTDDAVAREAARLLGTGGSFSRVGVHLVLDGRQTTGDASQLYLQRVGERFHLNATQFAVHHSRQEPDDASPFVVLHNTPSTSRFMRPSLPT